MFPGKSRPNDLVVPSCNECQNQTRQADAIASTLSFIGLKSDAENNSDWKKLAKGLSQAKRNIINDWTESGPIATKKARLRLHSDGFPAYDTKLIELGRATTIALQIFATKLALTTFFKKHGRCPLDKARVFALSRQSYDDGISALIDRISPWFKETKFLRQGSWTSEGTFAWRDASSDCGLAYIMIAHANESLFSIGTIVEPSTYDERLDGWAVAKFPVEELSKDFALA
jgi:hypothetical protein